MIIMYSFWRTLRKCLMFIVQNVNVNWKHPHNVHCKESFRSFWWSSKLDVNVNYRFSKNVNVNWNISWCSSRFCLMFIIMIILMAISFFTMIIIHFFDVYCGEIWCSFWRSFCIHFEEHYEVIWCSFSLMLMLIFDFFTMFIVQNHVVLCEEHQCLMLMLIGVNLDVHQSFFWCSF